MDQIEFIRVGHGKTDTQIKMFSSDPSYYLIR